MDPNIGRRCEARLRVRLGARVILRDGIGQAVLSDLSCYGARLTNVKCELRAGQDVLLSWGRFEAFGLLVWASYDGQGGIRFYEPFDREALLETRAMDEVGRLPDPEQQIRNAARAFVNGGRFV